MMLGNIRLALTPVTFASISYKSNRFKIFKHYPLTSYQYWDAATETRHFYAINLDDLPEIPGISYEQNGPPDILGEWRYNDNINILVVNDGDRKAIDVTSTNTGEAIRFLSNGNIKFIDGVFRESPEFNFPVLREVAEMSTNSYTTFREYLGRHR